MGRFHSTENGVVPFTAEEEAEADAMAAQAQSDAWQAIRQRRNALLRDSDWVVTRAYSRGEPVPQAWADYLQALRDVTLASDPSSVNWPVKPS